MLVCGWASTYDEDLILLRKIIVENIISILMGLYAETNWVRELNSLTSEEFKELLQFLEALESSPDRDVGFAAQQSIVAAKHYRVPAEIDRVDEVRRMIANRGNDPGAWELYIEYILESLSDEELQRLYIE
jgi:hypothetical protein